eukprot:Opistho-1_new@83127
MEEGRGVPFERGVAHAVLFGESFFPSSARESYHLLRYDFKPASVDESRPGSLSLDEKDGVVVDLPAVNGGEGAQFKGPRRAAQKECVLIYDRVKKEFKLEKITSVALLKGVRGKARPAGRPTPMSSQSHTQSQTQTQTQTVSQRGSQASQDAAAQPLQSSSQEAPQDTQDTLRNDIDEAFALSSSGDSSDSSDSSDSEEERRPAKGGKRGAGAAKAPPAKKAATAKTVRKSSSKVVLSDTGSDSA